MRKKNLFGIALSTAIVSLALASCSSDTGSNNNTGTPATTTATKTTTAVPTTTAQTTTNAQTTTKTTVTDISYDVDTKGLDVYINYNQEAGVSARQQFTNPLAGTTFNTGDILPVWKQFGTYLNTTIREASEYKNKGDANVYNSVKSNNFMSDDAVNKIDLFYNTTDQIISMGNNGECVDIMKYINNGSMPHFKAYLDNNPEVKDLIVQGTDEDSQKIFYTPYFDGYNDYERSIVMNTEMVTTVLDNDTEDTTTNGQGADSNVVQKAKFQPFMDSNYNYPDATTEITVSHDGNPVKIQVTQTTNIIKQQNQLLNSGCTGKQLADNFKDYLRTAYGSNPYYNNLSDIFISEEACYNTDDLVALMRVIKASPEAITGDSSTEIEILFPRGGEDNRINNILQFTSIFGIQGFGSEYEHLYYDGNGTIPTADTTEASFEAVNLLSQLYDEGLIQNNFYVSSASSEEYLTRYFGHLTTSTTGSNYGFMTYDYSATTGAMNSTDLNGIGTNDTDRYAEFRGQSVEGIMPVLPPYTYWQTSEYESDDNLTQSLSDKTGKTLKRYIEENRSIKSNSWCIPSTSDNIDRAVALMDYLYSDMGRRTNDYGPMSYWDDDYITYAGEITPQLSSNMKNWLKSSGINFWTFMRTRVGATHGIGHVREASLNYVASSTYSQTGIDNIENAINNSTLELSMVTGSNEWGTTVPNHNYGTATPIESSNYAGIHKFWDSNGKCGSTAEGWVKVVVDEANIYTSGSSSTIIVNQAADGKPYNYQQIKSQTSSMNTQYLYSLLSAYHNDLLPVYIQL